LCFRGRLRTSPGILRRLKSLLNAIYAESGAGNDTAASLRHQLEQDLVKLHEFQDQQTARNVELKALNDQLAASGAAALTPSLDTATLAQAEEQHRQRQQALNDAATLVKQKREALVDAQAAAAKVDAGTQQALDRARQAVNDLSVRIEALKLTQSGQANTAAKRFDAALEAFREKLAAIPTNADSRLLAYRSQARPSPV